MKTYQDKLVKGLINLGWQQGQSGKYISFSKVGHKSKLFVGSSGALRVGNNPSNSRSVGNPSSISGFYKKILDASENESVTVNEFPSVSPTLTQQNQNTVMSDKPKETTAADVLPKQQKKGVNPLELARKAKEVMQGQLMLVGGEIQRKLKDLVDDFNSLKEFGQPINWGDPSYSPYLLDLGLQPLQDVETPKTRKPRTPKTPTTADGEPTPKEKLVLEFIKENPKTGKEAIQKGVKGVGKSTIPQVITKLIQRGLVQNLTTRPSPAQYQAVK